MGNEGGAVSPAFKSSEAHEGVGTTGAALILTSTAGDTGWVGFAVSAP
jgi:hypothetical protein